MPSIASTLSASSVPRLFFSQTASLRMRALPVAVRFKRFIASLNRHQAQAQQIVEQASIK
jgi:hypothetical protein